MKRCITNALLVLWSSASMAMPNVSGTVISWPDDGWYQVQNNNDYTSICNGGTSCDVQPGVYNVINHTTGERFDGIIVGSADTPVTVIGNTITWPDDGWYQVQNSATYDSVCSGDRSCIVPDGLYVVINHTAGIRYSNIRVPATSSIVTVSGSRISWPDDGWYQVQDAQTYIGLCNGTLFCDVPDGSYVVINHSTGKRFSPIVVDTSESNPPIIRADNWQEILRNVVALINAERALERHNQLLGRFASVSRDAISEVINGLDGDALTDLGLTLQPLADPDNNRELDYSCANGGTLELTLQPDVPVYSADADNCTIANDVYDGVFFHNGVGREGYGSTLDNIEVNLANDSSFGLSGSHSTSLGRIDFRRSIQWADASMSERTVTENYSVTGFTMQSFVEEGTGVGQQGLSVTYSDGTEDFARNYAHRAGAEGSFMVSAPWTNNEPMSVTTDLSLDNGLFVSNLDLALPIPYVTTNGLLVWPESTLTALPSQWTSGSIIIGASDGSRLTLTPMVDDLTRAQVDISGISETQQVLWSDGYQVRCYGRPSQFPECQ